jgi:hypothetical protein
MYMFAKPNTFGPKLAVFAALISILGAAVARTEDAKQEPQKPAQSTPSKHDHKHPLPTTQEIPASLPIIPSAPHPSVSQAQDAALPQK